MSKPYIITIRATVEKEFTVQDSNEDAAFEKLWGELQEEGYSIQNDYVKDRRGVEN